MMMMNALAVPYEYEFSKAEGVLTVGQDPTGVDKGGIGATVWDSALVLGKFFEYKRSNFPTPPDGRGLRAVELGSGTGILALIFARMAMHYGVPLDEVVLTDKASILPLLQRNVDVFRKTFVQRNGGEIPLRAVELDWKNALSTTAELVRSGPFDVVLCSDCVHWPELFDPLVSTMEGLTIPSTQVYLTYERREFATEIPFFQRWGKSFAFRNVKEEDMDPTYQSEDIFVFTAKKRTAA
ncbi:putative methyltransferase-domain-containing protein [Cladochytrium replicatum]|nr:putative methyltransferase-domain-containing protein [Cladochytrium replicatum]